MVQISLVVSVEVAGFGSEEQRKWRQVAVKRETVFGGGEADFEVVFDSQRRSGYLQWLLSRG